MLAGRRFGAASRVPRAVGASGRPAGCAHLHDLKLVKKGKVTPPEVIA